jgi:hypothetical protein
MLTKLYWIVRRFMIVHFGLWRLDLRGVDVSIYHVEERWTDDPS